MPNHPNDQSALELIEEGVIFHRPDGQVSYGNPSALRILGVTMSQLTGKTAMDPWWKCIHPDGTDYPGEDHPAVISLRTGEPVRDAVMGVYNYSEDRYRWISICSFPQAAEDGRPTAVVVTLRDITDQKNAEDAEKETSQTLRTLFDAMEEMVVLHRLVLDDQGVPRDYRITDCNAAFTKITGIPREVAVGELASVVYGVDEPPYLQEFSTVGMTGEPYFFETYFAPMEKHFAISVVSPGPLAFATVSNDVTLEKKIQQALSAKNHELEQIVYVASHDLRSPLVNVDGYARELRYTLDDLREFIATQSSSPLTEKVESLLPDAEESLHHIRSSARQMDRLLKGLLQLSRVGRAAMEIVTIPTAEVVEQTLESFRYQIAQETITVEVGDLPPCRGSHTQVFQIFSNLIGNAIKYLDSQRPGKISITSRSEGGRVWYSVTDNGIGIEKNHLESVFELFHRLNPGDSDGEGLGLTIVKQLVERMDGEIRVDSDPGNGSTFSFSLPRARTE